MEMRRLGWLSGLMVVWLTGAMAQQEGRKFTDHGPQLSAAMIQGSIFVEDAKKNKLVYTVVRGEPAHLLAYDIKTKELILDKPLPGADGVWDMAQASDGALYIPGANGSLFKHLPGTAVIEDLGSVLQGETYLWSLTAGNDGEVFGATYPGCRVFRYHPREGFSDVGRGPLVKGENYVRSLAFHKKTGLLYAGVGSHAHLVEIEPRSGRKTELLPEKYKEKEFVYGLEIIEGKNGEDRLFTLLSSGNLTLVYNLKTKKVEQEIVDMDMKAIASEATSGDVFYTYKSGLMRFHPSRSADQAKKIADSIGTALAFGWTSPRDLYFLTSSAQLVQYHTATKEIKSTALNVPGQPIPINAIMVGQKGEIWTGGYLAGGHATFDPVTHTHMELKGLDQTEGMALQGDSIYFGIYPKGRLYLYDTQRKWDVKQSNPRKIAEIPGQSRSFAVLSVPDEKRLFLGMIPEYGKLGGSFVSYDVVSDELKSYEVIKEQAVASLIYSSKTIVGGTTISGGLGIKPSQKEAVLFGWDIKEEKKVFEIVPVPGAAAITGLINGPDGNVWGMADGVLFVFDVKARKVLSTNKLYDYPAFPGHIWRSAFLVLHPDGHIYGTDNNQLFKIDPFTKACSLITKDAALLVMDKNGTLYFKRKTNLWSYKP